MGNVTVLITYKWQEFNLLNWQKTEYLYKRVNTVTDEYLDKRVNTVSERALPNRQKSPASQFTYHRLCSCMFSKSTQLQV